MTDTIDIKAILSQVESKMETELSNGNNYEALQYVQSFVARKKKAMGRAFTSQVVFHGASQLVKFNAFSNGGSLIKWYIEDGAGAEHSFKINSNDVTTTDYCDVKKVVDLLETIAPGNAFKFIDAIYGPLHLAVTKAKLGKEGPLAQRMEKFEELSAKAFLEAGKYLQSFKAYIRLKQVEQAANVLSIWASKGYETEKPLFFGRALIHLLSENKVSQANELLSIAKKQIHDNIDEENAAGGGPVSPALAVWHLGTILTELANFPPMPRVDKTKIFGILHSRYARALKIIDPALYEIFEKSGDVVFEWTATTPGGATGPNPMAMLQGLFGASTQQQMPKPVEKSNKNTKKTGKNKSKPGGAAGGLPPGVDMDQMMRMMASMQQK